MANVKRDRKKLAKNVVATVAVIIVLVLGAILAPESNDNETVNSTVQNEDTARNSNDVLETTETGKKDEEPSQQVNGELILTMVDVGQADGFILEHSGKVVVIDCGTRSTGKNMVTQLQEKGITKIDYLFGTHPHDDHIGGMLTILNNFEIGKVIIPEAEGITSDWYNNLINALVEGDYEVEFSKKGNTYQFGDAQITVLAQMESPVKNINNYSSIMKITYGEIDIIMTGDAETEIEELLLESGQDISAEILKIGHHGSNTSTSEEFLDSVNPIYALISCSVGNRYKHPTEETMNKLQTRDIKVYRTDECGTVVLTITAKDITFNCDSGDYLSGPELAKKEGKS